MNEPDPVEPIDPIELLSAKYPTFRPVKKPPTLYTMNSVGFSVVGKRDFDEETGTYVKTHAFCALFIPLLAFGAYRVADAPEGGWYFLGKEKLSGIWNLWNRVVLTIAIAAMASGGYMIYINTPQVLSGKAMAEAARETEKGDYLGAVSEYDTVISSGWPDKQKATQKIGEALDMALKADDPQMIAGALTYVRAHNSANLVEDPYALGLAAVDRLEPGNPAGAVEVLEALVPLAPLDQDLSARRLTLLEALHQQNPQDVEIAEKLAALYSAKGEMPLVLQTLQPLQEQLKDRPSVGLLGQAYMADGQVAEAIAILEPYVSSGVETLTSAETRYDAAYSRMWDREFKKLQDGSGPDAFYNKYNSLPEAEQGQYVDTYLDEMLGKNETVTDARDAYFAACDVIPMVYDLGLAQMQVAQTEPDEAQRRAALEKAEKTFLSIKTSAGETDDFKLLLGQVKYWLGAEEEGRVLFNEVLTSNERSYTTLIAVASKLREVGDTPNAYKLFAEAYDKAETDEDRSNAANSCYLSSPDSDTEEEWLEKAGETNPLAAANLASHKGDQAYWDGDRAEAVKLYKKAIGIYDSLVANDTVLNNRSLIYQDMFYATGDLSYFRKAADDMVAALQKNPNDAIVVVNTIHVLVTSACLQVLAPHFDFEKLEGHFSANMLRMLYQDETGRTDLAKTLRGLPEIEQALRLKDRAVTIAPKTTGTYTTVSWLLNLVEDDAGLLDLSARCQAANVDTSSHDAAMRSSFADSDVSGSVESSRDYLDLMTTLQKKFEVGTPAHTYCAVVILQETLSLRELGEDVNLVSALGTAQRLAAEYPGSLVNSVLRASYAAVIDEQLAASHPPYAAMKTKMQRFWDAEDRLQWALMDPRLAPAVKANAGLSALLEEVEKSIQAFPGLVDAEDWNYIGASNPELAATIRQSALKDGKEEASTLFSTTLYPLSPYFTLTKYRLAKMQGDEDAAQSVLAFARDSEIPMPDGI